LRVGQNQTSQGLGTVRCKWSALGSKLPSFISRPLLQFHLWLNILSGHYKRGVQPAIDWDLKLALANYRTLGVMVIAVGKHPIQSRILSAITLV